ncbi:MAG TPA: hypothetical protein VHY79_12070 [Rhizomicrobium sp.]|nr:hypothetical protein [Rhizomicrobium sp.]
MGLAQPNLFAEEDVAPKRYVPNPQYVRNRLQSLLDEMRAAAKWPWEPVIVSLRCDSVLPRLYELLPDSNEARRWRTMIDAEIARLDAA